VRYSEWIGLGYFTFIAAAVWTRRRPLARRVETTIGSAVMCAGIVLAAHASPRVRDWAPFVFIGAGYYASGLLFIEPWPRFEQWLLDWDRRLLGDPATRFAQWPSWLLAYLDIVYSAAFLLLPAGWMALVLSGGERLADRYWSMVALAELGSFAGMAFLQSRPPWALERPPRLADTAVHNAAIEIAQTFSNRSNTFPSGHVAGLLAIALAILGQAPTVGLVFLLLAVSAAIACVVGRYHYIVDAVAGAGVAMIAWMIVRALGI
jgi:membrane-associated phospholipid phosphatase